MTYQHVNRTLIVAIIAILITSILLQIFNVTLISNQFVWLALVAIALIAYISRSHEHRSTDIHSESLPKNLQWDSSKPNDENLAHVYDFVVGYSESSVAWYQKRKRPKRILGVSLRIGMIALTTIAGLLPLFSEQLPEWLAKPYMTTVLLAVVALFLSLDRFGGYTSGWIRYTMAQMEIERLKRQFLMDWESFKLVGSVDTRAMELARTFLVKVDKIIDDETQQWATEFRTALQEIDKAAKKAKEEASALGALEVNVTNSNLVTEWTLKLDEVQMGRYTSSTAAVTQVSPGLHKIAIFGMDNQQKKLSCEKPISVVPGRITPVELELS